MNLSNTALGIELGSTRIKAVLIDENHVPVASGSFEWENQYDGGIWTYPMSLVQEGLQACFADLAMSVREKFGVPLTTVGALGVSAMMHGYLPFDQDDRQLVSFRTWRNTITGEAAEKLTKLFGFNIPQRWSIAHYYQAILNREAHVPAVAFLTTLAGYIHWKLTGEKVMGIGEASGMFPIDSTALDYDQGMIDKFREQTGIDLRSILPRVLPAGASGGTLTEAGARFLDPTGTLLPGIPVAPCEGDAGTGMVATNAVRPRTGNVSAGTSDFAMIVTEHPLAVHREIDMVTTPDGDPVAMVHCNNCTSDINAWVSLLQEFAGLIGADVDRGELFTRLFNKALEGDPDCGGLMSFNYFSGEGVTGLNEGRPIFARTPDASFNAEDRTGHPDRNRTRRHRSSDRTRRLLQDAGCWPASSVGGGGCTRYGSGDGRRGRPLRHGASRCLYASKGGGGKPRGLSGQPGFRRCQIRQPDGRPCGHRGLLRLPGTLSEGNAA